LEKQEETKKFIEDFVKEQQIWKQRDLDRKKQEDEAIEQYSQSVQNRDSELKQKKHEIEAAKEKIYEKVTISKN
jgi:polyhydroxyalkanoate synthesis regulator phasin